MADRSIFFDLVRTQLGTFQIAATEKGLTQIAFPKRFRTARKRQRSQGAKKVLYSAKRVLRNFISGKNCRCDHVPIDWRCVSNFDRRVLTALKKVPPKEILSYSELAKRANVPHAARAVGNALNRNPIPIFIPCHRVVRKDGTLGGYSGGIHWKQTLLKLEHFSH